MRFVYLHVFVSFQRVLIPDASDEQCASDQDFLFRGYILYMGNENLDQTQRMHRLIWTYVAAPFCALSVMVAGTNKYTANFSDQCMQQIVD